MRAAALALSIAAVCAAPSAAAQSAQLGVPIDNGRGLRDCRSLRAFVDLSAPGGRALRQGPGDEFPLLGRMTAGPQPGATRRVPVDVTATYNGWLRVSGPAVDAALAGLPESVRVQAGDNLWIVGWDVTAVVDSSRGFAFPRGSSRVAFWSTDGGPLTARARLVDIVACDDVWVYGRWEVERLDGLRYIVDLRRLGDPARVTAWTPAATSFPHREDRRRAMEDWLVETFGEEEASRAVRLSRLGEDFAITYSVSYWHGNGGRVVNVDVDRAGRGCWVEDDYERRAGHWRPMTDPAAAARELRAHIVSLFEACGSTPAEIASALRGFESAFGQVAVWDAEDRDHIGAVGRWIENVEGQGVERELAEDG